MAMWIGGVVAASLECVRERPSLLCRSCSRARIAVGLRRCAVRASVRAWGIDQGGNYS